MINLEKAKDSFLEYTSNYDITDPNVDRKIHHSLRVMELSTEIAKSLYLKKEEIDLATLIGLLHDIARFEQYKIYKTYSDEKSIDHGDLGVKILEENNFIRKFIETDKYDDIIKTAIKNHNKIDIEEGLDEKKLLFSKIIRDADKLDIFYEAVEIFWKSENDKKEIENSEVSEEYFKKIINQELINRKFVEKKSKMDSFVFIFTLMYNINFKFSFEYILKENFVNDILDRFNYTDTAKKQIEQIRKTVLNFLNEKVKN